MTTEKLWQSMQVKGWLRQSSQAIPVEEFVSPWYIQSMQGYASAIGAFMLCLCVSVLLHSIFNSPVKLFMAGCLSYGGVYIIFQGNKESSSFLHQLGLAMSIMGQVFFFISLEQLSGASRYWVLLLLQLVLSFVIPSVWHCKITTNIACVLLFYALTQAMIPGFSIAILVCLCAYLWLRDDAWILNGAMYRARIYGVTLAVLQLGFISTYFTRLWMLSLTDGHGLFMLSYVFAIFVILAVFIMAVAYIFSEKKRLFFNRVGILEASVSVMAVILALFAPSLLIALLVLLIGFSISDKFLMGAGLGCAALFLFIYYYQMAHTLLVKSCILFFSGLVLLGVRYWVKKNGIGSVILSDQGGSHV